MYGSQSITAAPYSPYPPNGTPYSLPPAHFRSATTFPTINSGRPQLHQSVALTHDDLQNNIVCSQLKKIFETLENLLKKENFSEKNPNFSELFKKIDKLSENYEKLERKIDKNSIELEKIKKNNKNFEEKFEKKVDKILQEIYKKNSATKFVFLNKNEKIGEEVYEVSE